MSARQHITLPTLIPMQFDTHDVTALRDPQGNLWWVAQGVCEILGLGNVARAMVRLDADEKRLLTISNTLGGPQKMCCVNEPGLWRLIMRSRKPEAKAFQRWLAHEVLPALRKTGRYAITPERFLANRERPTQVQHSRDVGDLQSAFGGRNGAIRYFRRNSKEITDYFPKEWVAMGKAQHLPRRERERGREVVRRLNPAAACGMSLADELVLNSMSETDAIAIGKESTTLFQRMLDVGFVPAELHSSPLDSVAETLPAREA